MKRAFLLFTLILISFSSIFAFDVKNSNGDFSNYFSTENSMVFIETSNNISSLNITFDASSITYIKNFDLNYCDASNSSKCAKINLTTISELEDNLTQILIQIGEESQNIYYDLEKPEFNFINSSIKDKKYLSLEYSYSDNSNKISKINMYKFQDSTKTFVAELKGITQYNMEVESLENFDLIFEIFDEAQNKLTYQKSFIIDDLESPKINSYFMTINNGLYKFKFDISDDSNLAKYEIDQDGLILTSDISGKIFEKEVTLPFTSGSFDLIITDNSGNSVSKTIKISNPFSINIDENMYSSEKELNFNDNDINSCYLTQFDSKSENEKFDKYNDEFTLGLDISNQRQYQIKFYCQDSEYKVYYNVNYFYDNESPSIVELETEKKTNGDLKIKWNESEDNSGDVKYFLYKDGDKIYSGSKDYFVDDEVTYPNTYNYYLKIEDQAGNEVETQEISAIPKKIFVNLETNLEETQEIKTENFTLKVFSDKGSTVELVVKNSNKIIIQKVFENVEESFNYDLTLEPGLNEISLNAEDVENNKKEQKYYITYVEPVLVQEKNQETQTTEIKTEPEIQEPIVKEVVADNNNDENEGSNFNLMDYFWYIIILLIFIILFVAYKSGKLEDINENLKLRKTVRKARKQKDFFSFSSTIDKSLDKDLHVIKQRRIAKQKGLAEAKRRDENKSNRILSDFEKKKLEDISVSKKDLSFNSINKKKIEENKKRKNKNSILKNLATSVLKTGDKFRDKLIKNKLEKEKQENREHDEFNHYLNKKKQENSWSNTREYLMKTKEAREEKQKQKQLAKQEEQNKKLAEQRKIDNEKRLKEEKKQKAEEEKEKRKQEKHHARQSLDDYLSNRTQKKRWLFTEREVERDISSRK